MGLRETAREIALQIPGPDAFVERWRHSERGPVSDLTKAVADTAQDAVDGAFDALWRGLPNPAEDVLHAVVYGLPDAFHNHRIWVQAEEALIKRREFGGAAGAAEDDSIWSKEDERDEFLLDNPPREWLFGLFGSVAKDSAKQHHQTDNEIEAFIRESVNPEEWDFAVRTIQNIRPGISRSETEQSLYRYLQLKIAGSDRTPAEVCHQILGVTFASADGVRIEQLFEDGLMDVVVGMRV